MVSSPLSVRVQIVALLTNHTTDGYMALAAVNALPRPKEKAAAAAPLAHAADANKPAHSNAAGKRKWVAPPDDDEEMERDFPL